MLRIDMQNPLGILGTYKDTVARTLLGLNRFDTLDVNPDQTVVTWNLFFSSDSSLTGIGSGLTTDMPDPNAAPILTGGFLDGFGYHKPGAGAPSADISNFNRDATVVQARIDHVLDLASTNGWTFDREAMALVNQLFDNRAQRINGSDGDDLLLQGGSKADIINGNGGDDYIVASKGNDTIHGGAGVDHIDYSGLSSLGGLTGNLAAHTMTIGSAAASNVGGAASATANGLGALIEEIIFGIENVTGTGKGDVIVGDFQNNLLFGGAGADSIYGLGNDDTIFGQAGNDSLFGNLGDDQIHGGGGNDRIKGNAHNDDLIGDDGMDTILGGNGDDFVSGVAGADTLNGGLGNDTILGGNGRDSICGGFGNDSIDGEAGNDTIDGGFDNDTILGGDGADSIKAGSDNDSVNGEAGNDTIKGGGGNDTILGGGGRDSIDGGDDNDSISGGTPLRHNLRRLRQRHDPGGCGKRLYRRRLRQGYDPWGFGKRHHLRRGECRPYQRRNRRRRNPARQRQRQAERQCRRRCLLLRGRWWQSGHRQHHRLRVRGPDRDRRPDPRRGGDWRRRQGCRDQLWLRLHRAQFDRSQRSFPADGRIGRTRASRVTGASAKGNGGARDLGPREDEKDVARPREAGVQRSLMADIPLFPSGKLQSIARFSSTWMLLEAIGRVNFPSGR